MTKKLMMMAVAAAASFGAWAETETVGGYTWTYRINGDTAEIYNYGSAAISPKPNGAVTIPSTLGGKTVTSIGSYAFRDCSGLTSMTIPDSVTTIGYSAFEYCSGLTSVTIPDSVTTIGSYAFEYCSGLTSVTVPQYVLDRRINNVFSSAYSSITNVSYSSVITNIGSDAFYNCSGLTSMTIPDSVTTIGSYAFYGCSGLTSVTIPDGVTSIGYSAFSGCSGLRDVTVPQYVLDRRINNVFSSAYSSITNVSYSSVITNIGSSAFSSCSGLTSVTIPNSVTSIGGSAFSGCSGLTSVTIPNSVTNIGNSAFSDCSGLTSITLPFVGSRRGNSGTSDSVFGYIFGTSYYTGGKQTYQYYSSGNYSYYCIPTDLKTVTITDETVLGYGAFYGCSGLTSVTIPDSVTSIGDRVFYNCSGLTSVTIPDSVTSIGDSAFSGCSGLASVTIPDSVTSIGGSAFYNCSGLTGVTIGSGVTDIAANAFEGCDGVTIKSLAESGAEGMRIEGDWLLAYVGDAPAEVTVPEGVKHIAPFAFSAQYDLEVVHLPSTLVTIGCGAFRDCFGINEVTIPDSVEAIRDGAFENCTFLEIVNMGKGLKTIGQAAFRNCSMLIDLECFDGLESVGAAAFDSCWRMLSVYLPPSVTNVAAGAFADCNHISGVCVPMGLKPLGVMFPSAGNSIVDVWLPPNTTNLLINAFSNLSSMAEMYLPADVTEIPDGAFYGCAKMTNVPWQTAPRRIGARAFSGCSSLPSIAELPDDCPIGAGAFQNCSKFTSFRLPSVMDEVPDSAFYGCSRLASVTFGGTIGRIGNSAFHGCALKYFLIPDSVTNIGNYAFYDCRGLTSMTIPASVKRLGGYVFRDSNLRSVYYLGDAPAASSELYSSYYPLNLTSYVLKGSRGWDGIENSRTLPEKWPAGSYGRPITWWEANTFDLVFDGNGGTPATNVLSQTTDAKYVLPATDPEREGWAFDGWWTERSAGARVTPEVWVKAAEAHTLYAHWTLLGIPAKVRFFTDGVETEQEFTVGVSFGSLPEPTKRGYVFAGWKTADGDDVTSSSLVHLAGAQLYAQWQVGAYSVRFMPNGGTGTMANQAFAYNVPQALSSNAFTRTDYAFAGWATNATAAASFADGAAVTNLTAEVGGMVPLYATWTRDVCTLSFNANGGVLNGASSRKVKIGAAVGELPVATREGYALEGWRMSDGTMATAGSAFTADATLTAVWTPNSAQTPAPTISPADGTQFTTASRTVTITCPVSGAAIYYTKNGATPRATSAFRYTGPFSVSDTATVVAMAVAEGMERSAYARATLTKVDAAGAALAGALGVQVTTGGQAWTADGDGTVRSGAVGANGSSWMQTTASGAGTFSFRWRVSCEEDDGGSQSWDRLVLLTNGVEAARIDGDSGWITKSLTFADDGEHVIRWTYLKDGTDVAGKTGEDCGWVGGITWTPEEAVPPPVSTTIVQHVEAPYALTDHAADRAIAAVTVDGDCEIGEFVLKDGEVYDCVLYVNNTADRAVTLTLPSGYSYKTYKGTKPLVIPAKSQCMLSITRVADKTFLVSREELEDVQ